MPYLYGILDRGNFQGIFPYLDRARLGRPAYPAEPGAICDRRLAPGSLPRAPQRRHRGQPRPRTAGDPRSDCVPIVSQRGLLLGCSPLAPRDGPALQCLHLSGSDHRRGRPDSSRPVRAASAAQDCAVDLDPDEKDPMFDFKHVYCMK